MINGIFSNKFSVMQELKISILIIIGLSVTIINPISWVVYLIVYKLGNIAGGDNTTVKMSSQWFAFLSAIIIYICIAVYIIYKVGSQ